MYVCCICAVVYHTVLYLPIALILVVFVLWNFLSLEIDNGRIFATIRKAEGTGTLRFKCKGVKLTNVEGFFGKSDPFFEISRKVDTAGSQTW